MYKEILAKDDIQSPMRSGIKKLASVVKRTLGPGGLPIIIERIGQALDGTPIGPKITKDGVSVAQECSSPDKAEDIFIQAVKAICKKTNIDAGDGTTTAIVLGEAIVEATEVEFARNKTLNPQLVKEEIEKAAAEIITQLKEMSTPVEDLRMIKEVATISANGDESIGEIVSEAFNHVGAEGMVTVDEGVTNKVTLEVVDGYQFNKGAQARDNFFNNKNRTHFETQRAAVVLFDGKVFNYTDLIPALEILAGVNEQGMATKKLPPVIFVANEFSQEVIQFLLIQKHEKGIITCCVEGPHMSHVRTGYYDDLAAYTGGERLGNGNRSLSAIREEDIGFVEKAIIDKYKTTLYDGDGHEDAILARVDQLKAMKELAESPYDAQVLSDRIAALTSGVAKIGVGGATELEIKEKYDRIEDALNASRAAIQEGVVPGGGTTLFRLAEKIDPKKGIGHKILKKALKAPYLQILENIGLKSDLHLEESLPFDANRVFDARNKEVVDAFDSGIIDPVKVTRAALENAVSIAGLLSTSGGAIIYKKDS